MDVEGLTETERTLLETLDADLRREMQVAPAPEFVARVRESIERTPQRQVGWLAWWVPLAAAAAIVLALLATNTQRPHPPRSQESVASTPNAPMAANRIADAVPPQPARVPTHGATIRSNSEGPRVSRRARAAHSRQPHVIVPPDQERALRQFVELIDQGRVDTSALALTPSDAEVVIEPLTIELLPPIPPIAEGPPAR